MKKIGVDCRFWGIEHAGLGRYTRELVINIANLNQKLKAFQFVFFFQNNASLKDKHRLHNLGCKIINVNIPHYSLKEQILFARIIDKQNLDLMYYPHFNIPILSRTPFMVTIHDLIKHFFMGKDVTTHSLPVYWFKLRAYKLIIKTAISRSRKVFVPSIFVRDQIISYYADVDHKKIKVIYEGVANPYNQVVSVSNIFKQQDLKIGRYKLKKTDKYFIYTGSAYYHKNLLLLLQSIKKLNTNTIEPVKLVIACGRNRFWKKLRENVKQLDLDNLVLLPGRVNDQNLLKLYQQAIAFIFPSKMEGFGLPGLEAMACGCPVISSNTGSLPEIYGKHALYFQPDSIDELVKQMNIILDWNQKDRLKWITDGILHSQKFKWMNTANKILRNYKEF